MNKCEELKMFHAWKDTTPNIVYPTNPPKYPPHQETCLNCGLVKTHREEVRQWVEYSDGVERVTVNYDGSVTIPGDDVALTLSGTNL